MSRPARRHTDGAGAERLGDPVHRRRLTDKILAAFNHAYAVGEFDIAQRLRSALAAAEEKTDLQQPERRARAASEQATLWVAYVEARNAYQAAKARGGPEDAGLLSAAQAMTEAFKHWSFS